MIPDSPFDGIIDRREVPALKFHPMVLGEDGHDLFPAGVADMDFRVARPILEALQTRLDHGIFGYEALPDGLMPALTAWLQERHGWTVEEQHIVRAPNVLNILAVAVSLFTEQGDGVIVQAPVFFDFFDVVRENGRKVVNNSLQLTSGRYEINFADLEQKAARPDTKMMFLCNPHNPVGRVWTRDELHRIGDICNRHGVLVIADEIHGDLVFSGHKYTPFAALGADYTDNSITCLSPAKTFNIAANACAFTLVGNADRRAAIKAENSRLTVNKNNAFANAAMEAAFTQAAPWLEEAMAYIEGNLDLLRDRLAEIPDVNLIEPEGTFLTWLDFRGTGLEADDLTTFLRQKAGWAVTRGHAFGAEGNGFMRLNIACPRAKLAAALDQLKSALAQKKRNGK